MDNLTAPIPVHLQDAHYSGHEELGHGVGYKYAHDYPHHYVSQQYLPDPLVDTKFYEPTENGYEANVSDYLRNVEIWKKEQQDLK